MFKGIAFQTSRTASASQVGSSLGTSGASMGIRIGKGDLCP